jgi:hypothetical protein
MIPEEKSDLLVADLEGGGADAPESHPFFFP